MNGRTTRPMLQLIATLCIIPFVLVASPANAQISPAQSTLGWTKLPTPPVDELLKKRPKAALDLVAEHLGMVRGERRTTTDVNVVETGGSGVISEFIRGVWQTYPNVQITEAVDFVLPAARIQIQREGLTKRSIEVVSGKQAWDETSPGIDGTPVPDAVDDRLRQIWLTPHGAMWGALRAVESNPNGVTLTNERGRLAVQYLLNGEPVKIVLNAELLPETVQISSRTSKYGANTVLVATYSGYKDFEGYLLQCPSRAVYKADGQTIRDVTVTSCVVNPYVIFPLPSNMRKASGGK